jgi:hypothetical protein
MNLSSSDLERRFRLSRELLSTHETPDLTADLVGSRLPGPGRHLELPFPKELAPRPEDGPVVDPAKPLPQVDVVVLTYTSDEGKALADVMTPGRFSSDWNHYTRKMAAFQFRCEKEFKNEAYAHAQYKSDWTLPNKHHATALQLMGAMMSHLDLSTAPTLTQCPCHSLQRSGPPSPQFIRDGKDGIPPFHPVLTTDYFEFGTDRNNLGQAGMAVEMDDAALGLACSSLKTPPRWASIRNYSGPAIDGGLRLTEQEPCAAHIYLRYGYWTSVLAGL